MVDLDDRVDRLEQRQNNFESRIEADFRAFMAKMDMYIEKTDQQIKQQQEDMKEIRSQMTNISSQIHNLTVGNAIGTAAIVVAVFLSR